MDNFRIRFAKGGRTFSLPLIFFASIQLYFCISISYFKCTRSFLFKQNNACSVHFQKSQNCSKSAEILLIPPHLKLTFSQCTQCYFEWSKNTNWCLQMCLSGEPRGTIVGGSGLWEWLDYSKYFSTFT